MSQFPTLRTNLCPSPDLCGSCGWSHIPYEKQLQQKLSDINGSFAIKKLRYTVEEIIAAGKTEHYRNRMDFVIDFQGKMGLREKGKWWSVIDDHTCFLGDVKIEELFKITRDWTKTAGLTFFDRKAHTGLLRYAVIRATSIGESMITVVTSAPKDEIERSSVVKALQDLAEVSKATTVVWSINHTITDVSFGDELITITGDGVINENIGGVKYRISPNAFFQTNSHMAAVLLDTVREFAGDLTGKTLMDLYCGTGFFAVAMAGHAKKTIGVELNPDAIRDAKVNAEINKVDVTFHDVATEKFDWMSLGADVVILDPPRSGMHDKALADVIAAKPERIVYVSCNYKNFARELQQLQLHYSIESMRAVDMFPHTPHVELITSLLRRPPAVQA
ncbi:TPA: 23S rRNA (uracil(1939)-C(5))-methyltransferase RlmD [Candidatus Uhrbacteria bacterium]|nr:23S rRNA (uracil(1939)-C(5))-methyltransferase RlmD [Candidatus Uhrbacteria bacterium]